MIPYLLAAIGGYLIGDSMKDKKAELPDYAILEDGGEVDSIAFDQLKKGDKIKITFGSSIRRDNEVELMVKSKNMVGKGKSYESEKITFINMANPTGVRFYAYKRKSGDVGFAIGDLAIYNVKIKEKFDDGGYVTQIIGKEKTDYIPFNHSVSDLELADYGLKIGNSDFANESLVLILELEFLTKEEEYTYKEYTIDLSVDDDGYSISNISSGGKKVSKEESDLIENDRGIIRQINGAYEEALDDYENEEDIDEDDYYEDGGKVKYDGLSELNKGIILKTGRFGQYKFEVLKDMGDEVELKNITKNYKPDPFVKKKIEYKGAILGR